MVSKDRALAAQSEQMKHDKAFHEGMEWFCQGYDRPREPSPMLAGWLAAKEISEVKSKHLAASREQFIRSGD